MARTAKANGEAIKKLRLQRGWDAEALASKAGVSTKTIANAEASKGGHYHIILQKIADALGADVEKIKEETSAMQQRRIRIRAEFDIDFESFCDSEHLPIVLAFLKRFFKIDYEPEPIAVDPGSTVVTVEVYQADVVDLLLPLPGRCINCGDNTLFQYAHFIRTGIRLCLVCGAENPITLRFSKEQGPDFSLPEGAEMPEATKANTSAKARQKTKPTTPSN